MTKNWIAPLAAVALATGLAMTSANAGPLPSLDPLKNAGAASSGVELAAVGNCIWSPRHGWHRNVYDFRAVLVGRQPCRPRFGYRPYG